MSINHLYALSANLLQLSVLMISAAFQLYLSSIFLNMENQVCIMDFGGNLHLLFSNLEYTILCYFMILLCNET